MATTYNPYAGLMGSYGTTQTSNGLSGFTSDLTANIPKFSNLDLTPTYKSPAPIIQKPALTQPTTMQPTFDVNALMSQILNTKPVTTTNSTQNTTSTQKQNASPQLEQLMNNYTGQLNTLNQNTQSAFQNKQNTYGDLIAALTNIYGAMGSGQSGAAQTSALGSGLTPLEAQQAGNTVQQQVMQQFFPQLAGTQVEQSQVGVDLQSQLAQLQQQLALPFIQNVQMPYFQNLAGQTGTQNTTGTQTTIDPYKQLSLLSQLGTAQQGNELGWAQLQQAANQFQQTLGNNQGQFGANLQMELQKLLSQQGMEQYKTEANVGIEREKLAQDTALRTYLQQLSNTGALAQTQAYGQNNLLNTIMSGTITGQNQAAEFARQQDAANKSASGDKINMIDSIWGSGSAGSSYSSTDPWY